MQQTVTKLAEKNTWLERDTTNAHIWVKGGLCPAQLQSQNWPPGVSEELGGEQLLGGLAGCLGVATEHTWFLGHWSSRR